MPVHLSAAPSAAQWPTEHPRPLRLSDIPRERRRFYVEDEDGTAYHVEDAQRDTTRKREDKTLERTLYAAGQFSPDLPVWECRVDLPSHLDIHSRADRAQGVRLLRGLVGKARACFYLHDVRTLSTGPEKPHAHVAVQVQERPRVGPGLWAWVRPLPLDLERLEVSRRGEEEGTLYGFLWYSTRPALPGAARPDRGEVARYSSEELKGQRVAAVKRRSAARVEARAHAQAEGKQRGQLARAFGWVNEQRPPRRKMDPLPPSVFPNLPDQSAPLILGTHLPDPTEQKAA